MSEKGTTNLNNLPNELKGENKVVLNIKDNNAPQSTLSQQSPTQLSPDSINQIVQGLQQASQSNLTSLPTKDIPTTNETLTYDQQVQPNFIPESKTHDYIGDTNTIDSLMQNNNTKKHEQDRLDVLYDELQVPLLSMLLYFFSNYHIFKKH